MQTDMVAAEVLYADTQKNGQMDSHAEPKSQFFDCFANTNNKATVILWL